MSKGLVQPRAKPKVRKHSGLKRANAGGDAKIVSGQKSAFGNSSFEFHSSRRSPSSSSHLARGAGLSQFGRPFDSDWWRKGAFCAVACLRLAAMFC